ncbi:UxaA family hydrolase [Marinicrinis lubricantis]|uniref:UxaA family hydrolase n=1 Tax=Marinicrinis lubricantis TaxID=2086470 RepID=A0ABW1IL09_9BACL
MATYDMNVDALVVSPKDNVATALKDLKAGEQASYRIGDQLQQVQLIDSIPFGHKVAIAAVAKGELVTKYGETIGRATDDIQIGQHVHIHNIEGIRGRGDQSTEAAPQKEA